jgi:hypothetical protein
VSLSDGLHKELFPLCSRISTSELACCCRVGSSEDALPLVENTPKVHPKSEDALPLVLVPVHLGTGTFGVDETYG